MAIIWWLSKPFQLLLKLMKFGLWLFSHQIKSRQIHQKSKSNRYNSHLQLNHCSINPSFFPRNSNSCHKPKIQLGKRQPISHSKQNSEPNEIHSKSEQLEQLKEIHGKSNEIKQETKNSQLQRLRNKQKAIMYYKISSNSIQNSTKL